MAKRHKIYVVYIQLYILVLLYIMSEKIFNRIKLLRQEKGVSRQSLAGAVGVNFQTIGYLERGEYNPSMKLAFKISRYFDLPVEAIFSDEPFESLTEILKREKK